VVERGEEVRDVGVHYPTAVPLQLGPDAPHGHVRRASCSEPEAGVREGGFKDRLQDLQQCLLADPIHDGGNAKRALFRRSWLVDLDPFHGSRPVAALPELVVQYVEVVVSLLFEPVDGHAINAASALLPLHLPPRPREVARVIDLADQRVRLPCSHADPAYPAPLPSIMGGRGDLCASGLSDDASVIAAATISPSSPTCP
jgi:hypothetical protein